MARSPRSDHHTEREGRARNVDHRTDHLGRRRRGSRLFAGALVFVFLWLGFAGLARAGGTPAIVLDTTVGTWGTKVHATASGFTSFSVTAPATLFWDVDDPQNELSFSVAGDPSSGNPFSITFTVPAVECRGNASSNCFNGLVPPGQHTVTFCTFPDGPACVERASDDVHRSTPSHQALGEPRTCGRRPSRHRQVLSAVPRERPTDRRPVLSERRKQLPGPEAIWRAK